MSHDLLVLGTKPRAIFAYKTKQGTWSLRSPSSGISLTFILDLKTQSTGRRESQREQKWRITVFANGTARRLQRKAAITRIAAPRREEDANDRMKRIAARRFPGLLAMAGVLLREWMDKANKFLREDALFRERVAV